MPGLVIVEFCSSAGQLRQAQLVSRTFGTLVTWDSTTDGYIPRLESKEWECWKLLDWRLNSENDSRLHGQPFLAINDLLTSP